MSTLRTANIQSLTSSTPPTIKDSGGTEIGTFCRAWVNFNGTGTVAIRGSFNVSSITDNGTGEYTVNFINSLVDDNYAPVVSCGGGVTIYLVPYDQNPAYTARNTSFYRFGTLYSNNNIGGGAYADPVTVYVSIFR